MSLRAVASEILGGLVAKFDGITFPATQVASSNANTLDDYEEGDWTPALTFGNASTGITYSTQGGKYTKIGRQVTCTGFITLSSNGSATGAAKLTGLPFTIGNATGFYSAVSFANPAGITLSGMLNAWAEVNTTTILLYDYATGTMTALDESKFSDTAGMIFSITYFV